MKDFYNIADLSIDWDEYNRKLLDSSEELKRQEHIQLWQGRFMLAIAQQLSVVASHLGKITRKAEDLNG